MCSFWKRENQPQTGKEVISLNQTHIIYQEKVLIDTEDVDLFEDFQPKRKYH